MMHTHLLDHVKENWNHLAKSFPYWSVLTDPDYKDGPNSRFWESGVGTSTVICSDLKCIGLNPSELSACEVGSGVGRLLAPMNKCCKSATGYDISQTMVDLCKQNFPEIPCNVYHGSLPPRSYDFVFSAIVLQHNPPPLIKSMLEDMFQAAVKVVWFQLPIPPIAQEKEKPDIPCIPMYGLTESETTEIGSKMGFTLASCLENGFGGECPGRQYTFLRNE